MPEKKENILSQINFQKVLEDAFGVVVGLALWVTLVRPMIAKLPQMGIEEKKMAGVKLREPGLQGLKMLLNLANKQKQMQQQTGIVPTPPAYRDTTEEIRVAQRSGE